MDPAEGRTQNIWLALRTVTGAKEISPVDPELKSVKAGYTSLPTTFGKKKKKKNKISNKNNTIVIITTISTVLIMCQII